MASDSSQTSAVEPYFTPDFFTPYYFMPLVSNTPATSGPGRFFAPVYFARSFFRYFTVGDPVSGPTAILYRDRDAFAAMVTALKSTGGFAAVLFGTTADRRVAGADRAPVAVITPTWWAESDDFDPTLVIRQVAFDVTLIVRDEDPIARFEQLDQLTALTLDAIDGNDLGGGCLPALTLIRRGSYDPSPVYPEQAVILHGEFTYLIPSLTSHGPIIPA